MKSRPAALGFRVKSGWAVVALFTGSSDSPQLGDCRMIELSDPQYLETEQPYHAAMGKLETDTKKIDWRKNMVQNIINHSISELLADYRRKGHLIARASLVVGSQRDPATIGNPQIRAHSLEGELFRSTLEQALEKHIVGTVIFQERDAYDKRQLCLRNPASMSDARSKTSVDIRKVPGAQTRNSRRSLRGSRLP
jgi:hypothetical protein